MYFNLTQWTWTFDIIYALVSLWQAYTFEHSSNKMYRMVTRFQLVLFAIVQTIIWLVTVLYWALMSAEVFDPTYSTEHRVRVALTHILHMFFPILDLFLSKSNVTWWYVFFPIFVVFLYSYTIVTIHLYTNKNWPYAFLARLNEGAKPFDVRWGPMGGFVIGTMLSMFLFFGCMKLLILIREKLGTKDKRDSKASLS
jgi:hypothetical protein